MDKNDAKKLHTSTYALTLCFDVAQDAKQSPDVCGIAGALWTMALPNIFRGIKGHEKVKQYYEALNSVATAAVAVDAEE